MTTMTTGFVTPPPADAALADERRSCSMCVAVRDALYPVFTDDDFVAFLDREPASAGHLVVAIREHIHYIDEVPADIAHRLLALLEHLARAVGEVTGNGHDVGIFLTDGEADFRAAPHVHVHVFPKRRSGNVPLPSNELAQDIRAALGLIDLGTPVMPANPGRRSVFWHDVPVAITA